MITTVTKIGDSLGVIFDSAFMDRARLKVGDQLNVEMHEDGTITLTPMVPVIDATSGAATAKRLIGKNSELFRRLS